MPFDHDPGSPQLEARLKRELKGEVLFDVFSRGRYSTDASIYQVDPVGVLIPASDDDVRAAIEPVIPMRGPAETTILQQARK